MQMTIEGNRSRLCVQKSSRLERDHLGVVGLVIIIVAWNDAGVAHVRVRPSNNSG